MIKTVCGEISDDQLGATLAHEHLYVDLSIHSGKPDNIVTDEALIISELAIFRAAGWTLDPAEEGSIAIGAAENYGNLQGRMSKSDGNRFLVTRRSDKAPNRVSQDVVKLTPGRLYSLRMYICDRGDLAAGRSVKKAHDITMTIDGGELLPAGSFREIVFNERSYAGFSAEHPLYMTYQRIVFRAMGTTATLALSDWEPQPDGSVGPIGQELAINYVQLQPYLEIDHPAPR